MPINGRFIQSADESIKSRRLAPGDGVFGLAVWIAIETSGRAGSVAAAFESNGRQMLEEASLPAQRRHNVALLPELSRLLGAADLGPHDITHIAVSHGPGSFTALRVGIVAARTLSQMVGAKLIAVPTLAGLAETVWQNMADPPEHLAAVLDAKRTHVFGQAFERTAHGYRSLAAPTELPPGELLAQLPRPRVVVGEGVTVHGNAIAAAGGTVLEPSLHRPAASAVLTIAQQAWAKHGETATTSYDRLEPFYVRLPEAEEKWRERSES